MTTGPGSGTRRRDAFDDIPGLTDMQRRQLRAVQRFMTPQGSPLVAFTNPEVITDDQGNQGLMFTVGGARVGTMVIPPRPGIQEAASTATFVMPEGRPGPVSHTVIHNPHPQVGVLTSHFDDHVAYRGGRIIQGSLAGLSPQQREDITRFNAEITRARLVTTANHSFDLGLTGA